MATKKNHVSLNQPESVTAKLKYISRNCHNHNHNQMTTLDVEQMCVSTDELTYAMLWLEEVALGGTESASHALALCCFIEGYARAVNRLPHNS
jgi:hypothetical protein